MKNLDLIEKYLNEELNANERSEFEQLQKSDPAFAEEVQMAVAVNADFNVQQKLRWQQLLEQKETPIRQLTPRKQTLGWIRSIAAVFILGLGLALGWLLFSGPNVDKIATQHLMEIHADPTAFADDNNTTEVDLNWGKAIKAYQEGEFSIAVASIESSIRNNPKNLDDKYFYLGLSYLYEEVPNFDKAIANLEKSKELNPNSLLISSTNWYLGLAQLKKGNNEAAKVLLQKVVDDKNSDWKKTEATALLNQL